MGGKSSKSSSVQNPATVWDPQSAYLQDMYSKAQSQYDNSGAATNAAMDSLGQYGNMLGQAGNMYGNAYNQMQQAGQGYQQGYANLGQAGANLQNAFALGSQGWGAIDNAGNALQGAYNGVGRGYQTLDDQGAWLRQFNNVGVDPMADVYARNVGRNFSEQIMPAIGGQAAMAGGVGSSRQGIAQGLAASRSSQQLQDFNAQLYGQQMDRSLSAAQGLGQNALGYGQLGSQQGQIGGMMNQNAGLYGQLGSQLGGIGAQQSQNALGYGQLAQGQGNLGAQMGQVGEAYGNLGSQYGNLSQLQQQAPWYAMNQYAGLLGRPTVLSGGGTATSTGGQESQFGNIVKLAGIVAAPFTGGASLAATAAVTAAGK